MIQLDLSLDKYPDEIAIHCPEKQNMIDLARYAETLDNVAQFNTSFSSGEFWDRNRNDTYIYVRKEGSKYSLLYGSSNHYKTHKVPMFEFDALIVPEEVEEVPITNEPFIKISIKEVYNEEANK